MYHEWITDAELEVMKVLWNTNNMTANEIIMEIQEEHDWNAKTIRTYLNRLVSKNVVKVDRDAKEYIYSFVVTKKEYYEHTRTSVANKLFNGSVNAMLLNFLDDADMDAEDIQELRELIKKYENRSK